MTAASAASATTAAAKGLNSMTRLPADGDSVHSSRSSRSTQSTPSLPLAPAAEKMKDEAGQQEEGNRSMPQTAPDVGVSAAAAAVVIVDTHKDQAGCPGDEGASAVEHSVGLPPMEPACTPVNDSRPSVEDAAPRSPQEACATARPQLEDSSSTMIIVDNDVMEEKGSSISHDDTVLSESPNRGHAPIVEQSLEQTSTTTPVSAQDNGEPCSVVETGGIGTPVQLPVEAEARLELLNTSVEPEVVLAEPEGQPEGQPEATPCLGTAEELALEGRQAFGGQGKEDGDAVIATPTRSIQDEKSNPEMDRAEDSEVVFLPSKSFTSAMPGYVFKTGDKGLGFYIEGYVDQPAKGAPARSHRPWNAGPGAAANRRGPLGPVPKPFKKIVPFLAEEEKRAAEESDT